MRAYLGHHLAHFAKVLAPSQARAREKVLNQAHPDIVSPVRQHQRRRRAGAPYILSSCLFTSAYES